MGTAIFFTTTKIIPFAGARHRQNDRLALERNESAWDVFFKWGLEVGSYGLRRQAERDAALDQARRLGCPHKSAVAAALCQRSPKTAACFMRRFLRTFDFGNTPLK
jgi:hypothetical protein